MAEDLLIDLPFIKGRLTTLPGGFTSGDVKATVVRGKTPMQGATLLSDTISLLPGTGIKSFLLHFCFVLPPAGLQGRAVRSHGVGGRGHE